MFPTDDLVLTAFAGFEGSAMPYLSGRGGMRDGSGLISSVVGMSESKVCKVTTLRASVVVICCFVVGPPRTEIAASGSQAVRQSGTVLRQCRHLSYLLTTCT
jgi:hypothetical protein